jgi:Replication-relaxation
MEFQMTARYVTAAVARELSSQLTETDLAILRRVLELRFASGDQLGRMHFAGSTERAARRALLRLTRQDVLERLPRQVGGIRAGSAGFVYRLGASGQRLALDRGWLGDRKRRRSALPGTLFLRHALAVAELHARLIEADRKRRLELLELRAEPACWRRHGLMGVHSSILKPDSFLRLGAGDFELSYFIEVDLGSEGVGALTRQLKAYAAYYETGREQAEHGVFPKVLWLAPDERRAEAIRECVKRLPRPARELFQVELFADAVSVVSNTATEPKSSSHVTD